MNHGPARWLFPLQGDSESGGWNRKQSIPHLIIHYFSCSTSFVSLVVHGGLCVPKTLRIINMLLLDEKIAEHEGQEGGTKDTVLVAHMFMST